MHRFDHSNCDRLPRLRRGQWAWLIASLVLSTPTLSAQVLVPGTGQKVAQVGDDFEDPAWTYIFNLPKSSDENDKQQHLPGGAAKNGRWFEGVMRGQPDLIKRVPTPEGGLAGSEGALLLRSQQTGVPGHYSGHFQQDDLIISTVSRMGGAISVARSPSCVVRVCLPPWDQWERRGGPSFGIRASCQAYQTKQKSGLFGGSTTSLEPYWPGFFIHFAPGNGKDREDSAYLTIRAGTNGGDLSGPKITEPGWWTFGMSFPPDGRVQYFCHAGVDDLTSADLVTTQNPYGFRAEHFDTFFFNVVSGDNGNWSTPWIIDDPTLYLGGRPEIVRRSNGQKR